MKDAFFRCSVCHHTVKVDIDRGKIAEPTRCPREVCSASNSMQIVHNRSGFADKQVIKLQETPDSIPDGQTPHSVSLCSYEELVDVCKAGDRIEVTGIFRSNPVRVNPRQRTIKNLFKTYIDVLHIQKVDVLTDIVCKCVAQHHYFHRFQGTAVEDVFANCKRQLTSA